MASSNAHLRDVLKFRLIDEGRPDLVKKLVQCAETFKIICTCCGKSKEVERGCKKRWCPVCAPKITGERVARYSGAAARMQWPMSVTLTALNTPEAQGCIKHLRACLTKFRRQKFWTRNVVGGITSIEVTNRGNGWHPHGHSLVDAQWLALETRAPRSSDSSTKVRQLCSSAHRELSAAWAAVLDQTEAVTWVNRAWGKALLECVKYAVKPAELIDCQDRIGPIIDEMHHTKLVTGFGTCYKMAKKWADEDAANIPLAKCDECGQSETYQLEEAWNRGHRSAKWAKHNVTTVAHAKELRTIAQR